MVGVGLLSTSLIQLIEAVAVSESPGAASQTLLKSLLAIFSMDQAALFSKESGALTCTLALDRSGKILHDGVFASQTLLESALLTMEPQIFKLDTPESAPLSIKADSLKTAVCLPLARSPGSAVFLGSRARAEHEFTIEELGQFKTAARAAWLAIRHFNTQENLVRARGELKTLRETHSALIYTSAAMQTVLDEVGRVAAFNLSLLLLGESGVGKEEVAKFVHAQSKRPGAFTAVNCANLSESLLESELFGYRKGAFTGATQNKDGLFRAADGGTLFLDEIAELPFNLQAKLLRALQERKVRPVGATEDIAVDVRVIAATHQDLEARIARGEFRADLYYRIQEFTVRVPALRERAEDIEVLADHFIHRASHEMNLPPRQLEREALAKLLAHEWPGNVRELKNICRTAVILARHARITPADLRLQLRTPRAETTAAAVPRVPEGLPLRDLARGFERQVVKQMFAEGLSPVEVAARLSVSVRTLQRNP